jgi:hypothetical protein
LLANGADSQRYVGWHDRFASKPAPTEVSGRQRLSAVVNGARRWLAVAGMPSFASKPAMDFKPATAARFDEFHVGARLPAKALGQAIPMAQKYCIRGQAGSCIHDFRRPRRLH